MEVSESRRVWLVVRALIRSADARMLALAVVSRRADSSNHEKMRQTDYLHDGNGGPGTSEAAKLQWFQARWPASQAQQPGNFCQRRTNSSQPHAASST